MVYDCQVQPEVLYIEVLYIDEGICSKLNVSTPIAMSKTEVHELRPLVITYIPVVMNKLHGIEKKNKKLCFALLIQNADAMASFQKKDSSQVVTLLLHARNFVSHVVPLVLLNTKVFLQHHFVFLFSEAFEVILFIVTIFAK